VTAVAASLLLSPLLAGDPIRLAPDIDSVSDLLAAVEPAALDAPAVVALAPGAILVHALTREPKPLGFRWILLPRAPCLAPDRSPTEVVLLLAGPPGECGRAARVAAHLVACFGAAPLVERSRGAITRAELVDLLASVESTAGEAVLADTDLLAILRTTPRGLTDAEAAGRLQAWGPNRLERIRRRPLLLRLGAQFTTFFAILLWGGGGLAFLAGLPELGWAIFAVVVINGIFSFLQEYRAERAVEALQQLLPHQITVLREGSEQRRPTTDIVAGDIVRLEEGDQVPADGQLLTAQGLRVDQSALTGESHPVFKLPPAGDARESVPRTERHELVFAGTGVVAGAGTYVVTATGMATEIGTIAHLTQSVIEEPSPLQIEMARVTRVVTALAVSIGAVFFALGVLTGTLSVTHGFVFALGVIVANVPEGLLPTLTLALALGVQRLARERSVVKRLSAVEELGATTVICTDKTGTLTQNRMAAHLAWASGNTLSLDGLGTVPPAETAALFQAAVLASHATMDHGDPTEVALVAAAAALGMDIERERRSHELLAPYPFDSFRKRMTLVRATDGRATAYVKGAPRETLALCTAVRWDAHARPLTDELRAAIIADHDRMAARGLRVLAVALRPLPDGLVGAPARVVECDLTFLGLVALWDPPRPEVAEAVALCRRAGIRIVMITGDYGLTAQAIGRQIGLHVDRVITGEEIERLPADALRSLVRADGVLFARTSPAHKLRIVSTLRDLGDVVAVTGDGVNDAPALKAADIGVAMGKRGSDVAKEAAEMVITDDNFASIVAAIRQGRATYANMGKFVTYIFASNVPELVPFLAFVFLGIPLPLTVMQILAVDLGTDLLPALGLGAEPPEPGIMDRPPRARAERLLGPARLQRAYGFLGVIEAGLALLGFFWAYWLAGWRPGLPMAASGDLYRRATTMTLSGIVAAQIGNVFACRTDRESVFRAGLFTNRLVLAGIAAEIAMLMVFILVPPFPAIFGLAPLSVAEWSLLLAFPPTLLLLEEARKAVQRWRGR
jgi:calcium-translocating P-type ATPase